MHRSVTRGCSLVLLATCLNACATWHTERVTPERVLQDSERVRKGVRVTLADGQRFEVEHPALSGDSLTGRRGRGAVAVPVAQVRELEVRRPNAPRTALLVMGSLVGAAGATLGVACIMFCGMTD